MFESSVTTIRGVGASPAACFVAGRVDGSCSSWNLLLLLLRCCCCLFDCGAGMNRSSLKVDIWMLLLQKERAWVSAGDDVVTGGCERRALARHQSAAKDCCTARGRRQPARENVSFSLRSFWCSSSNTALGLPLSCCNASTAVSFACLL